MGGGGSSGPGRKGVLQGVPKQVLSSPRLHIFSFPAHVSCCCGDQGAGAPQVDPGSRSWALGVGGFAEGQGLWSLAVVVNSGAVLSLGTQAAPQGKSGTLGKGLPRVMRTLLPSWPHMLTHLLGFLKLRTCAVLAVKDRTKAKAVPGAPMGHPKRHSTWRHRPAGTSVPCSQRAFAASWPPLQSFLLHPGAIDQVPGSVEVFGKGLGFQLCG